MTTTFQASGIIFIVLILLLGFGFLMWWYMLAHHNNNELDKFIYIRGAHSKNKGNVSLSCDIGDNICINKAIQICSDPDGDNFENSDSDPIDSGLNGGGYGDFDKDTTVDIKNKMSDACNGNRNCTYKFEGVQFPTEMGKCNGNTQLISTYYCIPDGMKCDSFLSDGDK